jgi:hypothetical protein
MGVKFKGIEIWFELSINKRKGCLIKICHVIKKILLTCKRCEGAVEIAYMIKMMIC